MVTISVTCPQCGQGESVRRYGKNRSGTSRCYCNACRCAFTLNPKPRQLEQEKIGLIRCALDEKTPVSTICRLFKVSPKTVYLIKRGNELALFLLFGASEIFWNCQVQRPHPLKNICTHLEAPKNSA